MRRAAALALLLATLVPSRAVRADILPSPTRPEWHDPAAPLPDPPDEEAARRWAPVGVMAAVAAGAAAALRRRTTARVAP